MNLLEKNLDWSMKYKCLANKSGTEGCLSLLEVSLEDIYLSYKIRFCRGTDGKVAKSIEFYYTFKCPCCGEETFINEKKIPLVIRKLILLIEKERGRRKIAAGKSYIS